MKWLACLHFRGNAVKLPHRNFLHLAAGAAALPAVSRFAQAYPTRPVRIIVGLAPGGPADIVARLIAQWLSEQLGQQFVVENRTGAATNIATEAVVRAPADGYTLLFVTAANAINTTLYEKLSFNLSRDIVPVAGLIRAPSVLEVNPSRRFRPSRFPTLSPMPRPIPASSPWRRVGSELPPMSSASCSSL
jgi:tripartite-type tricarboxylate transporter receptor subunit TctC